MAYQKLSDEDFIRIWQTCETRKEVMEKTGLSPTGITMRLAKYRKNGIPLKRYKHGASSKSDWKALAALAESLNGKKPS